MEEPVRKSMLEYVREMQKPNACRLIFCAKLTPNCQNIAQVFSTAIKENRSELITGLLLIFPDFIIHALEGTESEVYELCNDVFTTNPETFISTKCLFVHEDIPKRYFEKWYSKKIHKFETVSEKQMRYMEDNFETVSKMHKTMITSLDELCTELWRIRVSKNYENLIKCLESISQEGHPCIPNLTNIEFVLKSRWGYDLKKLVEEYCKLKYPCDIDNYSLVSTIISKIKYPAPKVQREFNYNEFLSTESDSE